MCSTGATEGIIDGEEGWDRWKRGRYQAREADFELLGTQLNLLRAK